MNNYKLTLKESTEIMGGISTGTLIRISKSDSTFPEIEEIGRSKYINAESLYQWLSKQAGVKVEYPDVAKPAKWVQEYFKRSHTWLHFHVKDGNLPKPFKLFSRNYWIESQIVNASQHIGGAV